MDLCTAMSVDNALWYASNIQHAEIESYTYCLDTMLYLRQLVCKNCMVHDFRLYSSIEVDTPGRIQRSNGRSNHQQKLQLVCKTTYV
jgi:hypothetical protein